MIVKVLVPSLSLAFGVYGAYMVNGGNWQIELLNVPLKADKQTNEQIQASMLLT